MGFFHAVFYKLILSTTATLGFEFINLMSFSICDKFYTFCPVGFLTERQQMECIT